MIKLNDKHLDNVKLSCRSINVKLNYITHHRDLEPVVYVDTFCSKDYTPNDLVLTFDDSMDINELIHVLEQLKEELPKYNGTFVRRN